MGNVVFTLYDIIQLMLMLGACYACFRWGHHRGMNDTIDFFESEGVIKREDSA